MPMSAHSHQGYVGDRPSESRTLPRRCCGAPLPLRSYFGQAHDCALPCPSIHVIEGWSQSPACRLESSATAT